MSVAVERDLQKASISPRLPRDVQPPAEAPGSATPHTVSELISKVPEVSTKTVPDNWVERVRKYIPAEVLVGWATTKQLLDMLFQGAVDTPGEITTFAVVWVGAALHLYPSMETSFV